MGSYTSKPTQVDAIQWTGQNIEEIVAFVQPTGLKSISVDFTTTVLQFDTNGEFVKMNQYDWTMIGEKDRWYTCSDEEFHEEFEEVVEP
jgi:hypothetical protein